MSTTPGVDYSRNVMGRTFSPGRVVVFPAVAAVVAVATTNQSNRKERLLPYNTAITV
jgi:hypothetical protein